MYKFLVLKSFYSKEFASAYVEGLEYTVRPGNEKLHDAVAQWVLDGSARILKTGEVKATKATASIKAKGTVK